MSAPAALDFRGHNPDVLTCIANLSNDEVFTPPEFANRMLDTLEHAWAESNGGASIWADPNVTFLDPFTKSGVFLREITRRLTEGLAGRIPDLQERVDHILTRQVYGIGITQLTSLLARRSVYCSKDATGRHSIAKSFDRDWGNVWFERTEHTWAGERCGYCRATRSAYERGVELETHAYAFIHASDIRKRIARLFGDEVKFDVIIGNPPYQLDDGGTGMSASPIYHLFIQQAKKLEPRFLSMVIPSRWMAGGKGLDGFRAEMFVDRSIRDLVDYPDAADVFGPGIKIKGGVCYFLRDDAWEGRTAVTTIRGAHVSGPLDRDLDEYDVFVRDVESARILKKVLAHDEESVRTLFGGDFGFDTNFADFHDVRADGDLAIHVNVGGMGHKRAIRYVLPDQILRGQELAGAWKVLAPKAAGYGSQQVPDRVLGRPIIAGPGEVATRTYRIAGAFASESEAASFESYYLTKFFRFLVMLRKITQDAAPKVYAWVPMQTWDRQWTDAELYEKYGLDADEIAFVEAVIRPLESGTTRVDGLDDGAE
ncbi:Eco57I restriction-modification methylase domain-containing protein [Microbacterium indicum]|uniref:Eco57I restriction-modification methylase domain-containing protein n=1 Tax=Microbacterium indicum TaxID=358100 RepID=UPI00041019DA|nr:Eco57I restriction-modification methylase domain-containing protein [Microbacterium indicum]